jgi:hypothetical protein
MWLHKCSKIWCSDFNDLITVFLVDELLQHENKVLRVSILNFDSFTNIHFRSLWSAHLAKQTTRTRSLPSVSTCFVWIASRSATMYEIESVQSAMLGRGFAVIHID